MVVDELADEVVDELFHALADQTRRDILRRCVAGESSVSRLRGGLPDELRRCRSTSPCSSGPASSARSAGGQLVRTDPDAVDRARQTLDELETTWRGRVERMSGLLAQVK